jgi:hypothetical protein
MTDSGSDANHHYAASCGELTPKEIKVDVILGLVLLFATPHYNEPAEKRK